MSLYKVEYGIPIPESKKKDNRKNKYPWNMPVGASFFVPGSNAILVHRSIQYRQSRSRDKYTARTLEKGVRVWRVK